MTETISDTFGVIEVIKNWDNGVETYELRGEWPERVKIAGAVLDEPNPAVLRKDGERLVFTLANGSAVYLIYRYDLHLDLYDCVRES